MSFFKHTLIAGSGRIIGLFLSLGIASASTRLLGPDGRGELAMLTVLGMLLTLSSSSGIEMATAYHAGKKKHSPGEITTSLFLIIAISTLFAIILGWVAKYYQVGFMVKISTWGLWISIAYVPTVLLYESMFWINSALGHPRFFGLGNILYMGISLLGMIVFCWYTQSPELAMLSYVIGCLFSGSTMLMLLVRKENLRNQKFNFSWDCFRDLYSYGIRYFFARFAQFLNLQIGTMVIAFLATKAETGYFSSAMGLVVKLSLIPEIVGSVLLSRVVNKEITSINITAKTVRVTFWLVSLGAALLAVLCKPLIIIIMSYEFVPAVAVAWILLPGIVIRCCSKVIGVYFNGIGRPGICSIAIICAVITNVVLMYYLLPLNGITGAAIAASTGYFVDALVLLIFYKFTMKHPLTILVPRFTDITFVYKFMKDKIRKSN